MEIWKNIIGYEHLYAISNRGRVKAFYKELKMSFGGVRIHQEKIFDVKPTKFGYNLAYLYNSGKKEIIFVHRLVAMHFIDNHHNKPYVNHIDGDKLNNTVENLEWCTGSENALHAYATGLKKGYSVRKGTFNEQNGKSRPIKQLDLNGNLIKIWPSLQEVNRQLKFHHANTGACARGNLKAAYGFKWSY